MHPIFSNHQGQPDLGTERRIERPILCLDDKWRFCGIIVKPGDTSFPSRSDSEKFASFTVLPNSTQKTNFPNFFWLEGGFWQVPLCSCFQNTLPTLFCAVIGLNVHSSAPQFKKEMQPSAPFLHCRWECKLAQPPWNLLRTLRMNLHLIWSFLS